MDQTEALAEDTLADILGRLPPRDLAASRCVRKAWHAIIDDHGLLLPHVLPRTVRGLFFNYSDRVRPCFFARPSSTRQLPATIDGNLSFLPHYGGGSKQILDHCNGLLLYRDFRTLCLVNPATRRWEDLPWEDVGCDAYLVFDPAVSLHYEVFSVPHEPEKVVMNPSEPSNESEEDSEDESMESSPEQSDEKHDSSTSFSSSPTESTGEQEDPHHVMESPPSVWTLNVFSSSTRQWQKRSFAREAEAPNTVTNMRLDPLEPRSLRWEGPKCTCSVYWQGSLYVHFRGVFVVRLFSSHGKYRIIRTPIDILFFLLGTPIDIQEREQVQPYIGKSEFGVYLAAMRDKYRLRVWTLIESSEQIYWVWKHHIDLQSCATIGLHWSRNLDRISKTWILDDDKDVDGNNRRLMRENLDWDSDNDNVVITEDAPEAFCSYVFFLGFHPYKEIVFLGLKSSRSVAVAYHLNSSIIQYLGRLYRKDYSFAICGSFPYTPCITGHLLKHFLE